MLLYMGQPFHYQPCSVNYEESNNIKPSMRNRWNFFLLCSIFVKWLLFVPPSRCSQIHKARHTTHEVHWLSSSNSNKDKTCSIIDSFTSHFFLSTKRAHSLRARMMGWGGRGGGGGRWRGQEGSENMSRCATLIAKRPIEKNTRADYSHLKGLPT